MKRAKAVEGFICLVTENVVEISYGNSAGGTSGREDVCI